MEALGRGDLEHIVGSLYPGIPRGLRGCMVEFNERLHHDAAVARSFAHAGGPWEFNLRDILRWGHLCCPPPGEAGPPSSERHITRQVAFLALSVGGQLLRAFLLAGLVAPAVLPAQKAHPACSPFLPFSNPWASLLSPNKQVATSSVVNAHRSK